MNENGTAMKNVALKDILVVDVSAINATFGLNEGQFRPVDMNRVRDMAQKWNTHGAGTVYLSQRSDGPLICLDGQHRTLAARIALGENASLPALVYFDLAPEEEAALFVLYNKERRQPSPYSVFHARLAANDMRAKGIMAVLNAVGIGISQHSTRGSTRAVSAVERVYDLDGGPLLRRTLSVLSDAWHDDDSKDPYSANAIGGMGRFLLAYPDIKRGELVKVLRRVGSNGMWGKMYQVQQVSRGSNLVAWGRALREVYNWKRTAHRLPEWPENALSPAGLAVRKVANRERAAKRAAKR